MVPGKLPVDQHFQEHLSTTTVQSAYSGEYRVREKHQMPIAKSLVQGRAFINAGLLSARKGERDAYKYSLAIARKFVAICIFVMLRG